MNPWPPSGESDASAGPETSGGPTGPEVPGSPIGPRVSKGTGAASGPWGPGVPDGPDQGLGALALRLLEAPTVAEPLVDPATYRHASLTGLIARLSRSPRPDEPSDRPDPRDVLALILAYFYAYVVPDSIDVPTPLDELTRLYDRFVHRRKGSESLRGHGPLRHWLLRHGFALTMLGDFPKTLAIVLSILSRQVRPRPGETVFRGLDVGSGTGILLLAQHILAARAGFPSADLMGIEVTEPVAERADLLLSALGVGRVILADARSPSAYVHFRGRPLHFVSNETVPSVGRRMYKEHFLDISRAMHQGIGPELTGAAFFPEAVWVSDKEGRRMARLGPDNAFYRVEAEMPPRLMVMRGIELDGRFQGLDDLGAPWRELISPRWRDLLAHRW